MSFTPIETQEALDKIISDRLKREAEKYTKQIEDLTTERNTLKTSGSSLQEQLDELNKQKKADEDKIAEQTQTIAKYVAATERAEVAREFGLPRELEDRLKGDNKDAMREDAESLKKIFKRNNVAPMGGTEPSTGEDKREATRKMLRDLKGEE